MRDVIDSDHARGMEGRAALSHFLLAPDLIHLNHGSFGALPKSVAAEQDRWRTLMERDPTGFFKNICPDAIRKSATIAAKQFGGVADDWVFCENATAAINSVLASLPLAPGDEIVTTSHAYGAVLNAMRLWTSRKGARVVVANMPAFVESNDQVVSLIAASFTPKTKLLIVDHITSATATVFPVAHIVAAARAANIPVLVDGAHATGQIPLDVPALGADWYTDNAHKWLFAPRGCGLLWTHPKHQEITRPAVLSHGAFDGYAKAFDWIGTRDVTPWLCLDAAVAAHNEFGGAALMARNRALAQSEAQTLTAALGAQPSAPPDMRASMAALSLGPLPTVPDTAKTLQRRLLDEHRIVIPVYGFADRLWLRISAQIYNEAADYRRLAEAVAAIRAGH